MVEKRPGIRMEAAVYEVVEGLEEREDQFWKANGAIDGEAYREAFGEDNCQFLVRGGF